MTRNGAKGLLIASAAVFAAFFVISCSKPSSTSADAQNKPYSIAVFVPGTVQGSPTYEMMVNGVNAAKAKAEAEGKTVTVKVVEGGFVQSDWQNGITSLVSTGQYDLLVTSNPSMGDICNAVSKSFPNQKFLALGTELKDNPSIKTYNFDQYQQAYLNGYFAAMVSSSSMPQVNKKLVIGLLAGQEYPEMNDKIKVGFLAGAQKVNPGFTLDFRVLGNWFDAAKATDLSRSMIAAGDDVILPIVGSAAAGVVSAAKEAGTYVTWYDSTGYFNGPGTVVGSTQLQETDLTTDAVLKALAGTLDYGTSTILGIKDGAVGFDFDSPDAAKGVPQTIIDAEKKLIQDIKDGTFVLPS